MKKVFNFYKDERTVNGKVSIRVTKMTEKMLQTNMGHGCANAWEHYIGVGDVVLYIGSRHAAPRVYCHTCAVKKAKDLLKCLNDFEKVMKTKKIEISVLEGK